MVCPERQETSRWGLVPVAPRGERPRDGDLHDVESLEPDLVKIETVTPST